MFIIVLEQHVSILIESSSGPSKTTDPYLEMSNALWDPNLLKYSWNPLRMIQYWELFVLLNIIEGRLDGTGRDDEVKRANSYCVAVKKLFMQLTLFLLPWRLWWAQINASKGQIGFNSEFKGLNIVEGILDGMGRRGRTRKQLLGDRKEIIYAIEHYWRNVRQDEKTRKNA